MWGGIEVQLRSFLTSELASRRGSFTPMKDPCHPLNRGLNYTALSIATILMLCFTQDVFLLLILIYLLNRNWVATRWQKYSTHLHTNDIRNDTKQTIHRTTQKNFWKSAGHAPSLRVIPWHLPYNRGKSTENPQSG